MGKTVELDGERYRVVGVVKDVPFLRLVPFADVWVPLTAQRSDGWRRELLGDMMGILLARDAAAFPGHPGGVRLAPRGRSTCPARPSRRPAHARRACSTRSRSCCSSTARRSGVLASAGVRLHGPAGAEPRQPQRQPRPRARLRDRRAARLRRLEAAAGPPVRARERGAHADRRTDRLRRDGARPARADGERARALRRLPRERPRLRLGPRLRRSSSGSCRAPGRPGACRACTRSTRCEEARDDPPPDQARLEPAPCERPDRRRDAGLVPGAARRW